MGEVFVIILAFAPLVPPVITSPLVNEPLIPVNVSLGGTASAVVLSES